MLLAHTGQERSTRQLSPGSTHRRSISDSRPLAPQPDTPRPPPRTPHRCLSASRRLSGDRPGWCGGRPGDAPDQREADAAHLHGGLQVAALLSARAGSPAAAMAARRSRTRPPVSCSCSTSVTEDMLTRQPTTRKRFLNAAPTLARAGAPLDNRFTATPSGNGSRKQITISFNYSDPASDEEARWPSM